MRTPSGFGLIHAISLAYERDLNPEVKRNEVTMVSKYNTERKYLEDKRTEKKFICFLSDILQNMDTRRHLKKLPKALAYQKQLYNDI